jgi:hypothetical protein
MKYRKLRIAWSMASGIVAVLLIALWVRSYWFFDDELYYVDGNNRGWYVDSIHGGVTFVTSMHSPTDPGKWRGYGAWNPGPLGFDQFSTSRSSSFRVPYWILCVGASSFVSIPWMCKRFGTRTLLITTTLVAIALGIIVWLH